MEFFFSMIKITILTVRFCKILIEKSEEKGKQMISKWKKKLRRASDRKCQKGIILRRRKNKRRRNLKALKGAEFLQREKLRTYLWQVV